MSAALDVFDESGWTYERLVDMLSEPANEKLDWRRFEIVDGALVVSPAPGRPHEAVVPQLIAALLPAMPAECRMLTSAAVEIGRSYRVPDLTVVTADGYRSEKNVLTGPDVLLAVEIESPSSLTTDRVTKLAQYANAGIACYWRIEMNPVRLVAYRLVDGVYAETGSWGSDETARITDLFPVEIEVGSLLPS